MYEAGRVQGPESVLLIEWLRLRPEAAAGVIQYLTSLRCNRRRVRYSTRVHLPGYPGTPVLMLPASWLSTRTVYTRWQKVPSRQGRARSHTALRPHVYLYTLVLCTCTRLVSDLSLYLVQTPNQLVPPGLGRGSFRPDESLDESSLSISSRSTNNRPGGREAGRPETGGREAGRPEAGGMTDLGLTSSDCHDSSSDLSSDSS